MDLQIIIVSIELKREELMYAEEIFAKLNATVINTEFKSIEESAFYIEKFYKDEKYEYMCVSNLDIKLGSYVKRVCLIIENDI